MAADYAEDKAPPPREYTLLQEMRSLGVGYVAGGLRDQPAGLMRRARMAELVIGSMRKWRAVKLAEWQTYPRAMRETVDMVLQLRVEKRKQERG